MAADTSTGAKPSKPRLRPWARVLLFCLAYVLAGTVLRVAWSFARFGEASEEAFASWFDLLHLAQYAVVLIAVSYLFWKRVDGRRWSDVPFGLASGRAWLRGFLLSSLWVGPVLVVPMLLGQSRLAQVSLPDHARLLQAALYSLGLLLYVVAFEAAFRGYVLQNLTELLGPGKGVWASAGLATLTVGLIQPGSRLTMLDLFLGAAALGYLRLGTGTLAAGAVSVSVEGLLPQVISSDLMSLPWITLSQPPPGIWFGSATESGLLHIWVSFFWLAGIYFVYYLPAAAKESSAEHQVEQVARIRPKRPNPR